jgi:hypothetical protein
VLVADGSSVAVCVASCAAIGTPTWAVQSVDGLLKPEAGQRFNVIDWPMTVAGAATAATSARLESAMADLCEILPFKTCM